jgi:hypothetical protein
VLTFDGEVWDAPPIDAPPEDPGSMARRARRRGLGDVVGEIAVLGSGAGTASVAATKPLRGVVWSKRDVWALEQTAPEAARLLRTALDGERA